MQRWPYQGRVRNCSLVLPQALYLLEGCSLPVGKARPLASSLCPHKEAPQGILAVPRPEPCLFIFPKVGCHSPMLRTSQLGWEDEQQSSWGLMDPRTNQSPMDGEEQPH